MQYFCFMFFVLWALLVLGCEVKDTKENLNLVCINGYVFKKYVTGGMFENYKTHLEPLHITCENGNIEVD